MPNAAVERFPIAQVTYRSLELVAADLLKAAGQALKRAKGGDLDRALTLYDALADAAHTLTEI